MFYSLTGSSQICQEFTQNDCAHVSTRLQSKATNGKPRMVWAQFSAQLKLTFTLRNRQESAQRSQDLPRQTTYGLSYASFFKILIHQEKIEVVETNVPSHWDVTISVELLLAETETRESKSNHDDDGRRQQRLQIWIFHNEKKNAFGHFASFVLVPRPAFQLHGRQTCNFSFSSPNR